MPRTLPLSGKLWRARRSTFEGGSARDARAILRSFDLEAEAPRPGSVERRHVRGAVRAPDPRALRRRKLGHVAALGRDGLS